MRMSCAKFGHDTQMSCAVVTWRRAMRSEGRPRRWVRRMTPGGAAGGHAQTRGWADTAAQSRSTAAHSRAGRHLSAGPPLDGVAHRAVAPRREGRRTREMRREVVPREGS